MYTSASKFEVRHQYWGKVRHHVFHAEILALVFGILASFGCQWFAPQIPSIVAVSDPADLELMESGVKAQYRELRAAVDAIQPISESDFKHLGDSYGKLGMWFHSYGRFTEADPCYSNARVLSPLTHRWPYYHGHVLRRIGRLEEARRAFNDALKLKSKNLQSLLWFGLVDIDLGNTHHSTDVLKEILEHDPTNVRALVGLARIKILRQQPQAALDYLNRAVGYQPEATEVNLLMGQVHRSLGHLESAQKYLSRGIAEEAGEKIEIAAMDPLMTDLAQFDVSSDSLLRQARRARNEGSVSQALQLFRQAAQAAPKNPAARFEYGATLVQAGRGPEAIAELQTGLQLEPRNAAVHLRLAAALELTDQFVLARQHVAQALSLAPNDCDVQLVAGKFWLSAGEFETSAKCFDAASTLSPGWVPACIGRTVALVNLSRYREARKGLEADLQVNPAAKLKLLLARILATSPAATIRDGNRAFELASSLFAESNTLVNAETLAMALAEIGDFEQASAWQEHCIIGADVSSSNRVRRRLEQYVQNRALRQPWESGERLDNPVSVGEHFGQ